MRRILVDLDSICADLLTPWIEAWNAESGDTLTHNTITSFDIHKCAKDQSLDIYKILERPGLFRDLKPLPGAVEGVRTLNEDKDNEVFIVSASPTPIAFMEKAEWVHEYMPFLTKKQIFFAHAKHLLTADVLIDDSPANAEAYRKAHPKAQILTIAYPYNVNCMTYDSHAPSWHNTQLAWDWILAYLDRPPATEPPAVCKSTSGRTDQHMSFVRYLNPNTLVCAFCGETE